MYSGGGERKPLRIFIEIFPTSCFCKKVQKILVSEISLSVGQKNFDSPKYFCQELFKNIDLGFHISVSRWFSCSEPSVWMFFNNQVLSRRLSHLSYRLLTGFKTLGHKRNV